MRTAIHLESHHHCKFRHLPQHPHREGLQSDLKSEHVSQVALRHHTPHSPCARFTPLLDETPEEIGIEVELDGIASDGNTRTSEVVNVSSALGMVISADKSCSGSPRARLASGAPSPYLSSVGGPGTTLGSNDALLGLSHRSTSLA